MQLGVFGAYGVDIWAGFFSKVGRRLLEGSGRVFEESDTNIAISTEQPSKAAV